MKAGSVGISLHDLYGSHQRVSIISPTWSAQDFIQAIGRIHRAGAKTDAIQKVVFCDGTIEEFICETLKYKLENLSKLNDGDFDTYKIDGISTKPTDSNDEESDNDNESEEYDNNKHEKLLGDSNIKTESTVKTKQLFNPVKTNKKKDLEV